MATFTLVHGSSSAAFYWDRVRPFLEDAGHVVVAPDLPTGDPDADFVDYADAVDEAVDRADATTTDLVVVGQSMAGFSAPIVAGRHDGASLVLIAPMIPRPGETPGDYLGSADLATAQREAAEAGGYDPTFDVRRTMLHDVPEPVVANLMSRGEPEQSEAIFGRPFPLAAWPDVPTRVIAGTLDRMFPVALVERLARERLGVRAERLDSGHLPGFGHPRELAGLILSGVGGA